MKVTSLTSFIDLGLAPDLLKALAEEGYATPTPIQAQAITPVLNGSDLLGIAQTGTGKTAAFALPILQRLAANRHPAPRKGTRVLVLSPTRELASQIADSFRTYGRHIGVTVGVVFGGVSYGPQRSMLARGVDVLVATPGRLLDHMQQGTADLKATEILVLDEADQMLDLGFLPPIRRIVARLSLKRQTLFFSATMPPEIGKLASEFLRDPVKVSVAPTATTVDRVDQKVILVEQSKKRSLLVELFGDPSLSRTLVFTRTKRGADRVAKHLEDAGIEAVAIHGNKSQNQREQALAAFKAAKIRVLVATDIAARGIDVDQVSHVVNYEMPDVPESYVHRIGRTARAGAAGVAISLVDAEERTNLRDIERVTRQSIPSEDRRNDAGLTADKTPAGARERGLRAGRGEARGSRMRGRNGDRPARGGHAAPGREAGDATRPHGGGRPHGQKSPAARAKAGAGEDRRPRRAAGEQHSHGGPSEQRRPHDRSGSRTEGQRSHGDGHRGEARAEAKSRHAAPERSTPWSSGQDSAQRNGIRFRKSSTANAKSPNSGGSRDAGADVRRRDDRKEPAAPELSGLGFMRRTRKPEGH